MSCEGCHIFANGQADAISAVRAEASKYGKEQKVSVAIWQEGFDWFYGPATTAISAGKPIRDILPFNQQSTSV